MLQSELANWVDGTMDGQFVWEGVNWGTWTPNWQAIAPINAHGSPTTYGSRGGTIARLDNITVLDDTGSLESTLDDEWLVPSGNTYNGIDYWRLNTFGTEPIPDTIELRQGKNAWIRTVEEETARREYSTYAIEGTAKTIPGEVIPNSVFNVIASGTVPDNISNVFVGPNESPVPDYTVTYGTNTIKIDQSTPTGDSSYKQMPSGGGIRYSYYTSETTTRTRCYILLS